jgi:hypothetical protein
VQDMANGQSVFAQAWTNQNPPFSVTGGRQQHHF